MDFKDYLTAAVKEAKPPVTRFKAAHIPRIDRKSEEMRAKRDATGRFLPGSNGGPGRPPGFSALIREMTGDGEELVMHALHIMRGEATVEDTAFSKDGQAMPFDRPPSFAEQQAARNWLADRGFGKSVERVEVAAAMAAPDSNYDLLPLEEQVELERLMIKASSLVRLPPPSSFIPPPPVVEGVLVNKNDLNAFNSDLSADSPLPIKVGGGSDLSWHLEPDEVDP